MFLLKAFTLSVFSPAFYREAYGKGLKKASLVLFALVLLMSVIGIGKFFFNFGFNFFDTEALLASDSLPTKVQIIDGTLRVEGLEMPAEFSDGGQYFAIDTTGELTEIPEEYNEAALITATGVIFRSSDNPGDVEASYADMNLENFSFTQAELETLLNTINTFLLIMVPVIIFAVNFVRSYMTVMILGLIGTLILSIMGKELAFRKSMIASFYVSIPVYYVGLVLGGINYLINAIGIDLTTLLCFVGPFITLGKWLGYWAFAVWGMSSNKNVELLVS